MTIQSHFESQPGLKDDMRSCQSTAISTDADESISERLLYVELIAKDEVKLPFRAGDLKISKLHLGKAVKHSKVEGTAGSIEEEQNVTFLSNDCSGHSGYSWSVT